jgi:hypothetical protein
MRHQCRPKAHGLFCAAEFDVEPRVPGVVKIIGKSGSSEEHARETAHAYWLPANPPGTQHADVNAGKEPIEVMVVELEKNTDNSEL